MHYTGRICEMQEKVEKKVIRNINIYGSWYFFMGQKLSSTFYPELLIALFEKSVEADRLKFGQVLWAVARGVGSFVFA